jgi:hypothetical protein
MESLLHNSGRHVHIYHEEHVLERVIFGNTKRLGSNSEIRKLRGSFLDFALDLIAGIFGDNAPILALIL